MASAAGERILQHLQQVARLRAARQAAPAHQQHVLAIKAYQARRFELAYADLLQHPRYACAARFFLEDLYGPQEFAQRDAQFARIVPALVRLFPDELVGTVASLAELHALTETMDDATAHGLDASELDALAYATAWQRAARPELRARQIQLTLGIGRALDRYTRKRMFRTTLHLMRGPAQAAGLGALQRFLERGFDAFGAMNGADDFLDLISEREQALAAALFKPEALTQLKALLCDSGQQPAGPLNFLPPA